MKITIKTITVEDFQVEAAETDTFKTLKEKITQAKGYPATEQRLVYAGKQLTDRAKIGDAKIDLRKFVVLILGKRQEAVNLANVAVALANSTEKDPDDIQDRPIPAPPPPSPASDPGSPSAKQTSGTIPQQNSAVASNTASSVSKPQDNVVTIFRNHPMLQTFRAIIRESLELLEDVLIQIGKSDPALASAIEKNRTKFLEVITEVDEPSAKTSATKGVAKTVSSQESQTDAQAINRLKAMGFHEDMVRHAYAASNKNESLAVELLLSQTNGGGNQ